MAGKKGKKNKPKTVIYSLGEFLGSSAAVGPDASFVSAPKIKYDEDDKEEVMGSASYILPNCPRTSRGPHVDLEKIPETGPFIAHIWNLPFEVEEPDIIRFFKHLKIESIKLPKDRDGSRAKGYGYVQFATRADLIESFNFHEESLRNRKIRVDLPDGEREGGERSHRREGGRWGDSNRDDDRSQGVDDWRAAPPVQRDEGRDRGFSDRGRYGGGRYDDERRGYGGSRADDEPWRRSGGSGGSFNDRRGGYERHDDPPKERPKLQLKPRSIPPSAEAPAVAAGENASRDASPATAGNAAAPSTASSIFGGAKPVDTATRERQIEERLNKGSSPATAKKEALKPSAADIFGEAKPVDTAAKEKEVELRLCGRKSPSQMKKETAPVSKPAAAEIFGAARPVDTLAREREIEEKMRKELSQDPHPLPQSQVSDQWRDDREKNRYRDERFSSRDRESRDAYRDRDSYSGRGGFSGSRGRENYGRDRNGNYGRDRESYSGRDRESYSGRDRESYSGRDRESYLGRDRESYSGRDRESYSGRDRESYSGRDVDSSFGGVHRDVGGFGRDFDRRGKGRVGGVHDRQKDGRVYGRSDRDHHVDREDEKVYRNGHGSDEEGRGGEQHEEERVELPPTAKDYDSDEERFLKAQPKKKDKPVALDVKNKFANLDLEEDLP